MKTIALLVLALTAGSACAEDCSFEGRSELRMTAASLEFSGSDKLRYKILNDEQLLVNDRQVPLTQAQTQAVKQYATQLRALAPEVRQLVLEGLNLGADAVDLVFAELLGSDNESRKKIHTEFAALKVEVEKNFAGNQAIFLNHKDQASEKSATDAFDHAFEARVNALMESAGKDIAWAVMKTMGDAALGGKDFEARMEKFGATMDREMNKRGEALGATASKVCASAVAVDRQEENLRKMIPAMANFDFIQIKPHGEESLSMHGMNDGAMDHNHAHHHDEHHDTTH